MKNPVIPSVLLSLVASLVMNHWFVPMDSTRPPTAMSLWLDSAKKSPRNPAPHLMLGGLYKEHGQPISALAEFSVAESLAESDCYAACLTLDYKAIALSNQAGILIDIGDFKTAMDIAQRAIDSKHTNTGLYVNLAALQLRLHHPDLALDYVTHGTALYGESAALELNRAYTFIMQGRCGDVQWALDQATRIDPTFTLPSTYPPCKPMAL